jgi:hypothetical protein
MVEYYSGRRLKLDNNAVIKTLTLYGNSLKKLYKYLPENCVKATPCTSSDASECDLEININGIVFTGKDNNSCITISSSNRNYTKEELIALQNLAIKCYTYPFGDLGFSLVLNASGSDNTRKIIKELLKKHNMKHMSENLDSEDHIELKISDIKDYAASYFINFILELQTLTELSGE